jgi:hypothetical protein
MRNGKCIIRYHFGEAMKKILPILMTVVFSLSACAPVVSKPDMDEPVINETTALSKTATPQVNEPVPDSANPNLVRGNVFLDSAELLTKESSPFQFTLVLKGNLPTPCDQLQVEASSPDSENKIFVDMYSVTEADKMCSQVLEPFEENFPLGSFPAGHYTIWVNGEQIAEFDT